MKEFTITPFEAETIRINIGDESFQIPLMSSLSLEEAVQVETSAGTISVLSKYIPEKIMNQLKIAEFNEMVSIWRKASEKAAKKSAGES